MYDNVGIEPNIFKEWLWFNDKIQKTNLFFGQNNIELL